MKIDHSYKTFFFNRTLLELGASPNYRDAKGFTPVYLSVVKKTDPKMTKSLLHDHGVLGTQDTQGWQEIHQVFFTGEALYPLLLIDFSIRPVAMVWRNIWNICSCMAPT
jgi:hypothetical protein